jgi:GT2 family glycosyltransferase
MMDEFISDITFVISTYKRHEFLRRCVASIKSRFPQAKIIIVNDDPADEELDFSDSGVLYHKNNQNMGCPKSRNIGASLVQTPFIFFLDDDATLGDVDLRTARELLIENDLIVICGFSARNHVNGQTYFSGFHATGRDNGALFFDTPAFNGGASLVKTNFFLLRGYHPRINGYGEEAELTLNALSLGFRVVSLREGGAIDHYPTIVARDANLSRQRQNDVTTAFEYGGIFLGLRQFAAHTRASMAMGSLRQLQGCVVGIFSGIRTVNLFDKKKYDAYQKWLYLARFTAISSNESW